MAKTGGGPHLVQCSQLREYHSAHPRSQTSQRTSQQGASFVGVNVSKVVAWRLLLFFRTLICDFELQPEVTLLSWRAWQQQLCSRWANAVSYDARRAAGRGPALWGVAGGSFAVPYILLEFLDASKGVLSGSSTRPRLTRCMC